VFSCGRELQPPLLGDIVLLFGDFITIWGFFGLFWEVFEIDFVDFLLSIQRCVLCILETAKFSEEPSFKMTLGRMLDMTYRFNVGFATLSINRMKEMGDPEAWVNYTNLVKKIKIKIN
jgi:hypothetical protein